MFTTTSTETRNRSHIYD